LAFLHRRSVRADLQVKPLSLGAHWKTKKGGLCLSFLSRSSGEICPQSQLPAPLPKFKWSLLARIQSEYFRLSVRIPKPLSPVEHDGGHGNAATQRGVPAFACRVSDPKASFGQTATPKFNQPGCHEILCANIWSDLTPSHNRSKRNC
jgi:hypothetical protein